MRQPEFFETTRERLEAKFLAGDLPEQRAIGAPLPTRFCANCRWPNGRMRSKDGYEVRIGCKTCGGTGLVR